MKTSRVLVLAILWGVAGVAGAQTLPKDLPWAVASLEGGGDWAVRVPQLLVRGWDRLPAHQVLDAEKAAWKARALEAALRALDQEESRIVLALDRKKLAGPLPATEPAATRKALADLAARRESTRNDKTALPDTLAFRAVWAPDRTGQPWASAPRSELLKLTQALYLVTGTVREIGGYVTASLELYSALEDRVLATWSDQFAPEEAPGRVAQASDRFRTALLGRPWAGLSVTSALSGAKVKVDGVWHSLPWSSDDLKPGTYPLAIQNPGRADEERTVVLGPEERTSLALDAGGPSVDPIVLDTVPSGIPLYLDSRYLGLSPQTVDRPLALSRVRAQDPAWQTAAWEIGPLTPSPSVRTLARPAALPSVPAAKDGFYLSLAAFSFSLTSSAFLGAWSEEQVKITNAYATAGQAAGYQTARDRYTWVTAGYATSVVLTSAVFVWMMVELGDYLGAAQSSLP